MEIKIESWDNSNLIVNSKYSELLNYNDIRLAEKLWNISGKTVKKKLKKEELKKLT